MGQSLGMVKVSVRSHVDSPTSLDGNARKGSPIFFHLT